MAYKQLHSSPAAAESAGEAAARRPAQLTTADFLARGAALYGAELGVLDEPRAEGLGAVSYGEHAARVRALAAGPDAAGLVPGDRVAVVSLNSARVLELFHAATANGRVLVPVNFRLSVQEVQYIVEHSGARLLLVDP